MESNQKGETDEKGREVECCANNTVGHMEVETEIENTLYVDQPKSSEETGEKTVIMTEQQKTGVIEDTIHTLLVDSENVSAIAEADQKLVHESESTVTAPLINPENESENEVIEQEPTQGTENTASVTLAEHNAVSVMEEAVQDLAQSTQNTSVNAENVTAMAEEHSEANPATDKVIIQKVEVLANANITSDPIVSEPTTNNESVSAAVEQVNESTTIESEQEKCTTKATTPMTGLNLLSQYRSDESDNDSGDDNSVIEMPLHRADDYRNTVVEINSDSDDSDTDSEPEFIAEIRKAIDRDAIEDDDDEDDDGEGEGARKDGKAPKRQPPKVKGELLLDDLPPIQDLQISVPEDECTELGRIHSIVEQLVLVSALPNAILLDLETVLFLDKGKKVLGEVFDVIGQVADPLYCIRFNSQKHIEEKNITIGDIVYVAPKTEYTQYIVLSKLTQTRGSDASWENDLEPPQRFLDYSDDEEERRARAKSSNRERARESEETQSDSRQAKSAASPPAPSRMQNTHRNSNNNSRGGAYRRPHQSAQHNYNNNNQQPRFPYNNYNPNSWHSNYYPPYNAGPQFNYQMPPGQIMPPYGPPPPQPPFNAPYNGNSMHPGFVPNPYAMMRSAPPHHPPGTPGPPTSSAAQSRYPHPH